VAELVRQQAVGTAAVERADRAATDLVAVAEFRDPIYPGLRSNGRVQQGGDKPFHVVINGENFHALEALVYTHAERIDAIYIDPPYNTRSQDWKYNNDYVDPDDAYAHSKWLAFMERRLMVAKRLLNPRASALIVTIDEKEYLRLGLLLEQLFPEATIEMVTNVISAKGAVRRSHFSRVEENIFFVTFGTAEIGRWTSSMLPSYRENPGDADEQVADVETSSATPIEWLLLRRREPSSTRGARPNQFYPIFVEKENGRLHSVGEPVDDGVDRQTVPVPAGTVALWPLKPDGTEMLWGLTPDVLRRNWAHGYVRVNWNQSSQTGTVQYLPSGTLEKIRAGTVIVTGRAPDGSIQGHLDSTAQALTPPKRVWHMRSHNAETGGTNLLSKLIPKRQFPYPKSLYAVEDALRFVVGAKRDAVVLDFFAGSGTTAHAVMRLNRQDDGRRQAIVVTNNEVSSQEESTLRSAGLRPGDPEWEAVGVCELITKPRILAAVTGKTPEGIPIDGDYRFNDAFPIAEGFEENVEFFTLTYEAALPMAHNRAFEAVAPLLWLRAGSHGPRIDRATADYDVTQTYGVLFDLDASDAFIAAVVKRDSVRVAFIVTDDDRGFQMVCDELPTRVEGVRLYESYLRNFAINKWRE
jgi:adenine-specific DNA-methyltransferase